MDTLPHKDTVKWIGVRRLRRCRLKSVNYVLMSGASEADSLACVISTHVDDACG
jgi:hypothetical protein